MSLLIQTMVTYVIVPLLYVAIVAFDVLLIVRQQSLKRRLQAIAGAVAGFLGAMVILLLDVEFQGLINEPSVAPQLDQVWPWAIIVAFIGFGLLLIIDLLLKRGVPFIIGFTIAGVFISGYYIFSLTLLRVTASVSAIGFLIGIIIYFIFFPTRIFDQIFSRSLDNSPADNF